MQEKKAIVGGTTEMIIMIVVVIMILRDRMDKGAAGKCSEEATTGGKNRWKGNDEDASRQPPPVFL